MLYSSLWLYACSQVLAPVALVLLKLRLGNQNRAVDIRGRVDFHLMLHFIRYYLILLLLLLSPSLLPVVPHKAVAEVSKIGNL